MHTGRPLSSFPLTADLTADRAERRELWRFWLHPYWFSWNCKKTSC